MNATGLKRLWAELGAQLAINARLRFGLVGIAAIVWIYLLLVVSDHTLEIRATTNALREEFVRLQPLARERGWVDRAEDARKQVAGLSAMAWTDSDIGLVEAGFQDWAKRLSTRVGLNLRELTLARESRTSAGLGASAPAAAGSAATEVIRARAVTDFNRLALLGFLAEVARYERHVAVDKLSIHLGSQPSFAEIDLRIVALPVGAKP